MEPGPGPGPGDELLLGQRDLSAGTLELLLQDRLQSTRRVRLLSVFDCALSSLPARLERFRGLGVAVLLANNNALTDLAPVADTWTASLTRLYAASNAIASVEAAGLERLTALERLDLSRNRLSSLPELLPPNLQRLDVHSNQLVSLSRGVGLLARLERLGVFGNLQLKALPPLDAMSHLTHLNCSFCSLRSLEDLPASLESLRCEGNLLSSLDVSRCTALRRLELRDNRLVSLSVEHCGALQTLGCGDNRLERVPEGLLGLPHLRSVALAGNALLPEKLRCDWEGERMAGLRETVRILARVEETQHTLALLQQQL